MSKDKKEEAEENYCELLIWNVPVRLKRIFKSKCNLKDISMQDAVIDMMKKFCKQK
jgi:hypothetical protein